MRLRERTFSEGSTAKGNQQRETYVVRRRNDSPSTHRLGYQENENEEEILRRHNTIPRGTRYYPPDSDTHIRRMSPRKTHQHYDT